MKYELGRLIVSTVVLTDGDLTLVGIRLFSSCFPPLQSLRWRQAGQDHCFVALGVNDNPLRVQLGGYVVSRGDLVEKVARRRARIHQRLLQLLLLFDSPRWTENYGIVAMQATEIMLLLVA